LTLVFALLSNILLIGLTLGVAHSTRHFQHTRPEEIVDNAFILIPVQFVYYLLIVGFMTVLVRVRHETNLLAGISWKVPDGKNAALAVAGGLGLAMCSQILQALLSNGSRRHFRWSGFSSSRPLRTSCPSLAFS
jgi:hypothetical protein